VSDFGLACDLQTTPNGRARGEVGTPGYMGGLHRCFWVLDTDSRQARATRILVKLFEAAISLFLRLQLPKFSKVTATAFRKTFGRSASPFTSCSIEWWV